MSRTITVGEPGAGAYDVVIGHDVLRQAAELLPAGAEQVLLVHAESLADRADTLASSLRTEQRRVHLAAVPDAEAAKTATVAERLWGLLGEHAFTRSDAVVALGGGTVTDLAGFVAATWLRGVAVVQVPTTLLAMVDAAVGGKTGINTAEGKNLVGSFHPPIGVVCDLDVLSTLPAPDFVAGLAEVIKTGFIADPAILEIVAADPQAATVWDGGVTQDLVERSIAVKGAVVTADLRESSLREILNYGHTFGHAVEQVERYQRRHGEAVAIGMVYAAELGRLSGHLRESDVALHREILSSVGLPTSYPHPQRWPDLLAAMGRDKKARGATVRFVILDAIAQPTRLAPDERLLRDTFAAVQS